MSDNRQKTESSLRRLAYLVGTEVWVQLAGDGQEILIPQSDTGQRFRVEYKTDYKAAETGNAFVETVSVDTAGKAGWAYSSEADYLIYFIPGDGLIYIIALEVLRRELPRWVREYPLRTAQNEGYATHGLLVPLDEFERSAEVVISV